MSVFYGRWSRHIYRLARVAMATPILLPSSCSCSLASPEWPPSSWSWPWQPIASGLNKIFWWKAPISWIFLTCFGADRCCRRDDLQFCWRSSPPTVPSLWRINGKESHGCCCWSVSPGTGASQAHVQASLRQVQIALSPHAPAPLHIALCSTSPEEKHQ